MTRSRQLRNAEQMRNSAQRQPHTTLRQLRRRAALSSRELARLAGTAPNTIRNAERGTIPKEQTQDRIAAALTHALGEYVDPLELWPLDDDTKVAA